MEDAELFVGLGRWILQDGNYDEFEAGPQRLFALELSFSRSGWPRLDPTGTVGRWHTGVSSAYRITADVVHLDDRYVVLDFGILGARQRTTTRTGEDYWNPWSVGLAVGDRVTGTGYVSVDPYFFSDGASRAVGVPPLVQTWTVLEVQVSTTPVIEVRPGDPRYLGRDPHSTGSPEFALDLAREGWRSVERTERWSEDVGSFRLRCRLEDVAPAREKAPVSHRR